MSIIKKTLSFPYLNHSLTTILAVTISFFFISFTSYDLVAGKFSDDAMYLLLAELYSPWQSNESVILDLIREESRFPPMYPLLLGLLGVDSNHIILASQVSCGFLLISLFIVGSFIYRETRNLYPSLAIVILFAFLPSTLIMSQGLWSEFLFICFIYSAFIYSNSNRDVEHKWLITALLIALSTLTRSIGISIAFAYILVLFLKCKKNKFLYIFVAFSPFIVWTLLRNVIHDYPGYFDDILALSTNISFNEFMSEIFSRIIILSESWFWLFSIIDSYLINHVFSIILVTIYFLFAIIGFLARIKQVKLDAICIPFYLAIIFIWPYQSVYFVSRFLYPLLPIFLFYMLIGIQFLPINRKYQSIILTIWILSFIIIAFPSTKQFIERGYREVSSELMPYRRSRNWLLESDIKNANRVISFDKHLLETLPKIAEKVSENECIYAYQAPIIILYTHRITSIFPPYTESSKEFELQTKACNLFLAMNITDLNSSFPPYYPMQHVVNNNKYVIDSFEDSSKNEKATTIFLIRRIEN